MKIETWTAKFFPHFASDIKGHIGNYLANEDDIDELTRSIMTSFKERLQQRKEKEKTQGYIEYPKTIENIKSLSNDRVKQLYLFLPNPVNQNQVNILSAVRREMVKRGI